MAFLILVLVVFIILIVLQRRMQKKSVDAGSRDWIIGQLLSNYKKLRENQDQIKADTFVIGYAQKAGLGGLQDNYRALAVRILDEEGQRRDGAEKLGMQVFKVGGKYYYQFPADMDIKMTEAEMTAVLIRTGEMIEGKYPSDSVTREKDSLKVIIDGKRR